MNYTELPKLGLKNAAELFFAFFKIGAFTFGGGLAMLPFLKRDLVDTKKWLTEEEIVDYFAIGQCTPGIIAVNVATFSGYKRAGIFGSIAATLGIITPSVIIIMLISAFLSNFSEIILVQKAFKGINIAAAVLLTKAVFGFGKKTVADIFTLLIAVAAFCAMHFFNITGVWIVLFSAAAGWLVKTFFKTPAAEKVE